MGSLFDHSCLVLLGSCARSLVVSGFGGLPGPDREDPIDSPPLLQSQAQGCLWGKRLLASKFEKAGLPVVTFEDSLSVHFNGEEVRIVHVPPAHTDGDIERTLELTR